MKKVCAKNTGSQTSKVPSFFDVEATVGLVLLNVSLENLFEHLAVLATASSPWQQCKLRVSEVSVILELAVSNEEFTDSLLLSPANGITRRQDRQIKSALFQFIEDTHKVTRSSNFS